MIEKVNLNELNQIVQHKKPLAFYLRIKLLNKYGLYFKDIESIRNYLQNLDSPPYWTKYEPKIHSNLCEGQEITALHFEGFAVKATIIAVLEKWILIDGHLQDAVLLQSDDDRLKRNQFILTHFIATAV